MALNLVLPDPTESDDAPSASDMSWARPIRSLQLDPSGGIGFGGIAMPAAAAIRVMRYGQPLTRIKALTDALSWLEQRIPSFMQKIGDQYNINLTSRTMPTSYGAIWPQVNPIPMVIDAGAVKTGAPQEAAPWILHELLHLPVREMSSGNAAKLGLLARPRLPLQDLQEIAAHPETYGGRDLADEVIVRMMQNNIARRRLGL